jgi:predicted nucleotidyltransferase
MLDRDHLAGSAAARSVFATISGAHLYGFASPDSGVDLRGAFCSGVSFGLHPPAETITIEDKTTIDLDWIVHDISSRLMTNHNGYVLEQLYSPLSYLDAHGATRARQRAASPGPR